MSPISTQTPEQIRAAAFLETSRVNTIRATADQARTTWGQHIPPETRMKLADVEAVAIRDGWTQDQAELEIMRAARPQFFVSNPYPGGAAGPDGPKIIEAALAIHIGHEAMGEKEYGPQVMQAAKDCGFRHVLDIFRAALRMNGQDAPSDANEIIRAALGPGAMIRATGFSTMQLPATLSNLANKTLLNAYRAFPSVAKQLARVLNVRDFKVAAGMRVTGEAKLEKIGSNGEIPHGFLGESVFAYQLDTYAKTFGISRQDIINDDLNSFAQTPLLIGRGAAHTFEEAFWKMVLLNGTSTFNAQANFFSGANNNYLPTAATSSLNYAGLASAVATMFKQVDPHGYPINLVPRYVVVPPELKAEADQLYRSTTVVAGQATTNGQPTLPNAQTFFGLYEPAVSPYLSNSNYTNNSATGWYLFGDPGDVSAFGVAYLNGQSTPTIEYGQQEPDILGIYWRAFLDFAVCQIDPRGAVFSTGTG